MSIPTPSTLDRYQGTLVGLAAGDALGTTLEFTDRNAVKPIDDMIGGGPFRLAPGQWTDDTSMAMCLAESLIERGFDARDQMERYVRWWKDGYWSSTGRFFDIGTTVSQALQRFIRTGDPIAGSTDPHSAGNGSLMRLAPVALRYAHVPAEALKFAAESSKTTHEAADAVDACRYFAALIVGALDGCKKDELLAPSYAPPGVDWNAEPVAPAVANIANGSYKTKAAGAIRASGYVVHTLEAALWAFFNSTNFRDGALLAVNLGEDADTTGAVYGQLAGAYYGIDGIPREWRKRIVRAKDIATLATVLLTLRNTEAQRQLQMPRDLAARLGREGVAIGDAGSYVAPSGARVDIRAAIDAAVRQTIEYPPDRNVTSSRGQTFNTRITVENATVLAVGRRMHRHGPVAALNFASAEEPGGGFLSGARAQEESIARASALYHCLRGRQMYEYHRGRLDAMYSDWVIYSPDVPVFRGDSGALLEEPWPLSVITSPAVHGKGLQHYDPARMRDVPDVMRKRTAKVLAVASSHAQTRVILGAWGCGAFGLDPEMMAGIFHDALDTDYRGVFEEIVFAITDWSDERRFIGPFERAFRGSR